MRTEQDFLVDVINRLNVAGIDYMLTGSMASNFWGTPRTTHDLDFVLLLRPDQIDPFASAFEESFFIQRESVRSAFHPPHQFNVLDLKSALKADFWLLGQSEFEQEMFRRRVSVDLFGVHGWVVTAEDVLLHKLYWNRLGPSERQLLDAAGVFAVQARELDHEYLKRWAALLGVSSELEDLFTGKLRPKST